jgi:hypothetical protein
MKKWFHVNKNVEYSTDINFFIKNQLYITGSETSRVKFCSRLESKVFELKINIFRSLSDEEIDNVIKEIHQKLINNFYHKNGKLID